MSPFTRARHGDLHVAGVWVLAPPDGLEPPTQDDLVAAATSANGHLS